ncbi:hypothetical protein BOTBODRAFT_113479 [Botryobasidium botryosum FD-172 SS1]|uniref:Structural maintenance of chromosomes protein n=1 Tax=Botryobasidium botryosum (strain FD-172 SS1) TaxID=930990 RepID=A0A067MJC1_BOTB1|nr:hypothetical protein BOTBODRAFT_113479 [Botryobasidium botryosum FD-172 SS1]
MYIKTLTIQGFKSYRDQTAIEPFSPAHNVVVGRNGSGKSNFFAAIRFVLSDAYTSMSREERQALLHEGVSVTTTLSAYVEIVFDNSDNRFPTGKEEVVLRRTIGLKKDEYSLDKKSASKADVMNLLESAGFSKSNPYYIVPQGRITSLTNAKDHERLALLKEVAGTKVYEQRRSESLRIMDETEAKRSKIKELLTYIEERLAELEEEKEELREFQEKDKERRCLEYGLYQRELEEVGEALEELEADRKQDLHSSNKQREKFNDREKEISELEADLASAKHELSILNLSKHGYAAEMHDLVRSRTELECVVADMQQVSASGEERREALENDLAAVVARFEEVERELQELLPVWTDRVREEREEKRRLDEAKGRLQALYAKQGRISQFNTRAERDAFLQNEITSYRGSEQKVQGDLEALARELETSATNLVELVQRSDDAEHGLEDRRRRLKELSDEIHQLSEEKTGLTEQRKDLWREDAKLDSTVNHARDEFRKAERNLASMMDKDTGSGLRAVDKITERLQLEGVYGPLYRLFEVADRKYNTAVELTAGTSLFHVVVDTDDTASRVLDVMLKERTGRVTFMPLNRLKPKPVQFPQAPDAIPLIEKLSFDPAHAKAFEQVFGKTCVCKDLTVAAAYVRSHNLNTITIDGDKVDRKGAMTGGYHDIRRSRIEGIKAVKMWSSKLETESRRHAEVKEAIQRLEQEITAITGRIQVRTGERSKVQAAREPLANQATWLQREREKLQERIARFETIRSEQEAELSELRARREACEAELATPMATGLSAQEAQAIEQLSREVDQRSKLLIELAGSKNEVGSQKTLLEIELNESLRRRREELRGKIESIGETDVGEASTEADLEARQTELNALVASIDDLSSKVAEMETQCEKYTVDIQKLASQLEKAQTQQAEDIRDISKRQKNTERYLAKRQMLSTRKDECNKNIRDLGVLPEEAFEKYTNVQPDKLVKRLHIVNESLKKFAHVNKKAFEQYNNFTKQRDQLLKRREDLEASASSIEELVEVLDQRKDEAIERTFKQVSKYFEEVFEKLVPAGRGKLIMQKRIDQEQEEEEDEEEAGQQSKIDNYTGVSIKVSFNSKVDEGLRIQQLSGGQKSLVALATVFAIQKCDPAPFYLFDEIDANLDAQYRTAVASMIHELSATAQFITTTFRPEMLVRADKFYGVLFDNQKVSSIRGITREEAREFVEQEAQAQ